MPASTPHNNSVRRASLPADNHLRSNSFSKRETSIVAPKATPEDSLIDSCSDSSDSESSLVSSLTNESEAHLPPPASLTSEKKKKIIFGTASGKQSSPRIIRRLQILSEDDEEDEENDDEDKLLKPPIISVKFQPQSIIKPCKAIERTSPSNDELTREEALKLASKKTTSNTLHDVFLTTPILPAFTSSSPSLLQPKCIAVPSNEDPVKSQTFKSFSRNTILPSYFNAPSLVQNNKPPTPKKSNKDQFRNIYPLGSGLSPGSPSYDKKHTRFSHFGTHALDVFYSPEDDLSPSRDDVITRWRPTIMDSYGERKEMCARKKVMTLPLKNINITEEENLLRVWKEKLKEDSSTKQESMALKASPEVFNLLEDDPQASNSKAEALPQITSRSLPPKSSKLTPPYIDSQTPTPVKQLKLHYQQQQQYLQQSFSYYSLLSEKKQQLQRLKGEQQPPSYQYLYHKPSQQQISHPLNTQVISISQKQPLQRDFQKLNEIKHPSKAPLISSLDIFCDGSTDDDDDYDDENEQTHFVLNNNNSINNFNVNSFFTNTTQNRSQKNKNNVNNANNNININTNANNNANLKEEKTFFPDSVLKQKSEKNDNSNNKINIINITINNNNMNNTINNNNNFNTAQHSNKTTNTTNLLSSLSIKNTTACIPCRLKCSDADTEDSDHNTKLPTNLENNNEYDYGRNSLISTTTTPHLHQKPSFTHSFTTSEITSIENKQKNVYTITKENPENSQSRFNLYQYYCNMINSSRCLVNNNNDLSAYKCCYNTRNNNNNLTSPWLKLPPTTQINRDSHSPSLGTVWPKQEGNIVTK